MQIKVRKRVACEGVPPYGVLRCAIAPSGLISFRPDGAASLDSTEKAVLLYDKLSLVYQ